MVSTEYNIVHRNERSLYTDDCYSRSSIECSLLRLQIVQWWMSSINNICNRYLQLTTIVMSLALNVFKLQMQKKKKKKRLQQQRNKSKIIRTLQISIYSVSNGPIDRKESKKERKKRGAIFRSTGCRRYLTSFSTRSGTRSSRLRETEREREFFLRFFNFFWKYPTDFSRYNRVLHRKQVVA